MLLRFKREKSESVNETESFQCFQNSREAFEKDFGENSDKLTSYCNATWDSIYCWPFTPPGTTLTRPCHEVMKDSSDIEPAHLSLVTGEAIRICGENGTWLWGNWTNYNQCLESLDRVQIPTNITNATVVNAVRWILFLGSIMSFLSLSVSLFIFHYFKTLKCDRVKVHVHLMLSLALRFILLIIVTEPFIFQREVHYRTVNWICKGVTSLLMYVTVASINWMFIQGHYLHSRLTTNIFDKGAPFKIYYCIGWVLPLLLIGIWGSLMETHVSVHCWQSFSKHNYIWILVGPMVIALLVNFLFLINIMRILLTKIKRTSTSSDSVQFRRAVKATGILFPLLGINNLLFVYNPGGSYESAYMLSNTILLSSQGVLVSFFYCFCSNDVREVFRREYRKFQIRRSANSIRHSRQTAMNNTSIIYFTPRPTVVRNGPGNRERSSNPSPETLNFFQPINSLTSSPIPSPITRVTSENHHEPVES